jgi:hypothetical protein
MNYELRIHNYALGARSASLRLAIANAVRTVLSMLHLNPSPRRPKEHQVHKDLRASLRPLCLCGSNVVPQALAQLLPGLKLALQSPRAEVFFQVLDLLQQRVERFQDIDAVGEANVAPN